ncbi:MAG: ABC transporter permease, partial [Kiritimatiellia bacterium]|nr:ABC transporter permease [Kiritimatiellia bacterium]
PDTLDALHVQARDDASLHRAIERADRVLSAPDLAVSETAWITPDLLRQRLRRWRDAVAWGTGCLAALCLLLGGTGLMNLFFADVRNRMPEIGLRLSLGARPVEVAAIFLQEAFLISLAAVAAALLAAGPALHEVARQTGLPFALDVDIASRTILAALVFGALFSFLPARLAARVSAAEALRND